MIFAISLLTLSSLLPVQQTRLKLPERSQRPGVTANVPRPVTEVDRFRRDLDELASAPSRTERKLQEMGLRYPAIDALIIEVARSARSKEMGDLMIVARRFGADKVAAELRFQLLSRPLGRATRTVVEAMTFLMGPERDPKDELNEKKALQDCIMGRVASARRPATEAFALVATAEDMPFVLALTSHQSLDLQFRGVDLLKAIDNDEARARLVKLLSKGPALAGATCRTIILLRQSVVPALLALLDEPPIDRAYSYAAFALAEIGEALGQQLLPSKHTEQLRRRLSDREALTRSLSAIALADLDYYSPPSGGASMEVDDVAIGDALLDLVSSKVFVPNFDLLRRPAEQRLIRMTGRVVKVDEVLSWREWWELQRQGFVGIRATVAVTEKTAADAVVTLRSEHQIVRLVAEGLADIPPLQNAQEVLLTQAEMYELVTALQAAGFGDAGIMRNLTGLPAVRTLEIQVHGSRALVGVPAVVHRAFDALEQRVELEIDQQLWQLYRHARDEPDRAAFWRAERRWQKIHTDGTERGRRFARRVFKNWPVLTPWLRGRALQHLFARKDRKQLFDETDGDRILALVREAPTLGQVEMSLLELAAGMPGDRIWRECVSVAASVEGGGRDAVRSVFAVLGPDAVLAALSDEREVVRRVAIDEVVVARDVRAGPQLLELLQNAKEVDEVRRAAVYACGQLRLAIAHDPLVALITADETAATIRRECLHALGRTGGKHAFSVLDRALRAPIPADREAALKGLGELRDPRAAHTLAELAVIAHGKNLGTLARLYLGRMGASLAIPALRHQVRVVKNPAIHDQLVLLLGRYQDPKSIPELVQLLRTAQHKGQAAIALMGTTGIELLDEEDPWGVMTDWWRKNRAQPQWQWLLTALAGANEATVLRPAHFLPTAGRKAVPELARLLSELQQPRLYVLTAAVLRVVSKEDFGAVNMATPQQARAGIAARYRLLLETQKAAKNR